MNIADKIKSLRKEMGITQAELAMRLKINVVQIVRYETGASLPSVNLLTKIARFFEVSTDYLIFGEDKEMAHKTRIYDTSFLELFRRINQLKKGQRDKIKWTIEALLDKEVKHSA